jgi:hypothetical protein
MNKFPNAFDWSLFIFLNFYYRIIIMDLV